jgi:Fic family protein
MLENELDFSNAVDYHYDQFPPPPKDIDLTRLVSFITNAALAIGRYDQMLKSMHNSEILLAPLRKQEAVISSRMEGTISTMDEILRYEADNEEDSDASINQGFRTDVLETILYSRTMQKAQDHVLDGRPIDDFFIRSLHQELLRFGRGAEKSPGKYKNEQNYLVDKTKRKVRFIPISPAKLNEGLEVFFKYMQTSKDQSLIKIAISHIEFEALHPFKDGNGRIGRMIITLLLWQQKIISAPHFYISGYLEEQKEEYIDLMRKVSSNGDWTSWCEFFLIALEKQAEHNLEIATNIQNLYENMKNIFRETLGGTKWLISALDFVFTNPIFRTSKFKKETKIPLQPSSRIIKLLIEKELLILLAPAAGSRPALYAFEPLLRVVRV